MVDSADVYLFMYPIHDKSQITCVAIIFLKMPMYLEEAEITMFYWYSVYLRSILLWFCKLYANSKLSAREWGNFGVNNINVNKIG